VAPFFTEEVRRYLEQKYTATTLYEGGLSVQTGIDFQLQQVANVAVERGLRAVDKRRGYRRDKPNVLAQGQNLDTYRNDRWSQPMVADDVVPAVVMAVDPASAISASSRYHTSSRALKPPETPATHCTAWVMGRPP